MNVIFKFILFHLGGRLKVNKIANEKKCTSNNSKCYSTSKYLENLNQNQSYRSVKIEKSRRVVESRPCVSALTLLFILSEAKGLETSNKTYIYTVFNNLFFFCLRWFPGLLGERGCLKGSGYENGGFPKKYFYLTTNPSPFACYYICLLRRPSLCHGRGACGIL